MTTSALTAKLYINGRHVGDIAIRGWEGAWGIGNFKAVPEAFAEFEPMFSRWSRLMHADNKRLSRDNAKRLRDLESRMYALNVRLWVEQLSQWREVVILTIDGDMIEWKEPWAPGLGATKIAPRAQAVLV
jgi:hypothetical protein